MTGKTCLKSPPNTKTFPPKGLSMQVILRKVLSTALKMNLYSIGASSQMKSLAALIKQAFLLPREIAEIPEEATANAISLQDLTIASKVLHKKVLSVPPGPSIKKQVHVS
ncbi:hypothetical protein RhiirC2_797079 [Rhizophagus irregularis]|uniref:Uncharacterized protein n=1 Tax=Rhizophagus irregularis TaxID=588596 RepID=A0A2N1M8M2_9GLOM|nr:hypothetical protein RhiirC2_797079 [Rhizophagus irregularis]